MSEMPISLLAWKEVHKNTLRGFAEVRLGESLRIKDVAVHTMNGRRWAALPARPVLDKDGQPMKDDRGKTKYFPLLEWMDRETADRFSEGVIAAVEREHPGATAADAA